MALTHGLTALASPACLFAFLAYAALTALLPLFDGLRKVGGFLNSCVLTLGTPILMIFLTLSAGRAMLRLVARHEAGGAGTIHANGPEVAALIVLAVLLCLALAVIEFASIDTRGLPAYLVGLLAMKLFFDANAPNVPIFPGWLATLGIFLLVAVFAILLRLAATEESGDIAAALKRDPQRARVVVTTCLTPALNLIPAVLGVCLYGAAIALH